MYESMPFHKRAILLAVMAFVATGPSFMVQSGRIPDGLCFIASAMAETAVSAPSGTLPMPEERVPAEPDQQSGPKRPPDFHLEMGPNFTSPAHENTSPEHRVDRADDEPATFMDVLHGGISRRILSTATWLDSFFGDRRYGSELNQTYVRFRYNVFLEEDSGPLLKSEMRIRIVLPQLRERTHLVISSTPQERPGIPGAGPLSDINNEFDTSTDRNVTAALQYQIEETDRDNFTIKAGIKYHNGGPVAVLGPRYRMLFPFDIWSLRLVERLTWRSDTGWFSVTTADLERPLPYNLFFRATNEWLRTEHLHGYAYTVNFVIRQPLSLRRALEYEWVNIFQTRPVNELEEVVLRIRYRQRIWRDWLFFELTPQYRFPRDRAFEATPGVLFRFETMFGYY